MGAPSGAQSKTARSATGRMPGPLTPPPTAPSAGRRASTSMARPRIVLTSTSALAPAPSAAPATSTRSGVLGLSLAHSGRPAARQASTTSAVARAECANIRDRSSRFGQLALTSTAATSAPASASAAAANSSTVRPQSDATTVAPRACSAGRCRSRHAATPGPARPTELTMWPDCATTRGAGLPSQANAARDLTTTAPSAERSP